MLTFLSVVGCCVLNIIEFKLTFSSAFVTDVLNALGNPALLSILGSRMMFNLKEAAELGINEGTNVRVASRTMSAIDFAEPGNPQPQRYDF